MLASEDDPNLIIWPETSVPGYLNYDYSLLAWLRVLQNTVQCPMLIGAPMIDCSKEISSNIVRGDYNSALLFSKKSEIVQRYDKTHLVLFGEFIPLEDQLPFLRKIKNQ